MLGVCHHQKTTVLHGVQLLKIATTALVQKLRMMLQHIRVDQSNTQLM
jgi:hypothetical protein